MVVSISIYVLHITNGTLKNANIAVRNKDISNRHLNLCLTWTHRNVTNNAYSNFKRPFERTTSAFIAFEKLA